MAGRILINDVNILARGSSNGLRLAATSCQRSLSSRQDKETKTHTGQIFEKDDYRNVRFTDAKRYVNQKWAINLIDEIPPKECTERVVCCDGGDGPLGHPKVYINLDQPGSHICVYCGLRFVKKDSH